MNYDYSRKAKNLLKSDCLKCTLPLVLVTLKVTVCFKLKALSQLHNLGIQTRVIPPLSPKHSQ